MKLDEISKKITNDAKIKESQDWSTSNPEKIEPILTFAMTVAKKLSSLHENEQVHGNLSSGRLSQNPQQDAEELFKADRIKTLRAVAPESLDKKSVGENCFSKASDIFHFAHTLIVLLTGGSWEDGWCPNLTLMEKPKESGLLAKYLLERYLQSEKVLFADIKAKLPKWVPKALQSLILHCIQRDPNKRPTAREVYQILESNKVAESKSMIEINKARGITVSLIHDQANYTNPWLSVLGDKNELIPFLLKYVNRNWHLDIETPDSGLETIGERLQYHNARAISNPLYVGKISLGSTMWLYMPVSIWAGYPEIHAVYPVGITKEFTYYCKVKQQFMYQNALECLLTVEILNSDHKDCLNAIHASMPEEAAARALRDSKVQKLNLTLYPIAFLAKYKDLESGDVLAMYVGGIASWLVRKPMPCQENTPASHIPYQRPYPYRPGYELIHGVIPNEKNTILKNGVPSNEQYVQGICLKIEPAASETDKKHSALKKAYWVTLRIDPIRNIDINIWVLEQHMIDGNAIQEQEKPSATPPGCKNAIPEKGDLVFAKAWIYSGFLKKCDLSTYRSEKTTEPTAAASGPAPTSASIASELRESSETRVLDKPIVKRFR